MEIQNTQEQKYKIYLVKSAKIIGLELQNLSDWNIINIEYMGIIVPKTFFHYVEKSMNKRDYKPRMIDRKLEEYLNTFGAVCVEGPKWCGKTWSSSYHSNSEIMIGNPD